MADSMIQLSPDSTGKKVDTEELTVGLNSVHRERMQIAGDSPTDIAPVTAADGLTVNLGTNNDVTVAGVSTLAEQQAQSALLTTIDADTSLLAGAVAGTEVQVDIVSLPNEGQQTMLNSISVAIATDQSAVPVSGTVAVTGSATLAEQQAQTALLTTIDADTGGILTAVQIMDDWDETNRAAVNTIAGQVGVQGASGIVTALTQRVVLATDVALPAGTNNIGDVDVASSALPTGASTLAEQQAQTTLLGTIDADTSGILTAVQILDNAISGSEMQVDVVGALPTGTNNIGDVDVASIPSGWGKTILSAGGSAATSGNNTLIAAGTNRLKVVAFSLTTLSTTAMTCIFQSGASGTELWRVVIQAPTGVSAGANLSTTVPGWLFATASATLLNLNLSSANAVHWSVSYYDEA